MPAIRRRAATSRSSIGSAANRSRAASSAFVISGLPGRVGGKLLAQFGQAASAGWADASDRHAERLGDGGVVRTIGERDHAQQRSAAFVELFDVLPEPAVAVVAKH